MTERPWYQPRDPQEIEPLPWIHPDAVRYFENIIKLDWKVLEHGAGGSTLWLAQRCRTVVTIEHDPDWRMMVREKAPANVTILESFPDSVDQPYDCFFIDGAREERGLCLLKAPEFLKPGGWVVLDNSNRPEYAQERRSLIRSATLIKQFSNNVNGSQYFLTEFWRCD